MAALAAASPGALRQHRCRHRLGLVQGHQQAGGLNTADSGAAVGDCLDPRQLWQPSSLRRLYWREWGGDSVVFDSGSGLTHQFSPLAGAVMAWLETAPQSLEGLVAAVAGDLETVADAGLVNAVRAVLVQFRDMEWIEASSES